MVISPKLHQSPALFKIWPKSEDNNYQNTYTKGKNDGLLVNTANFLQLKISSQTLHAQHSPNKYFYEMIAQYKYMPKYLLLYVHQSNHQIWGSPFNLCSFQNGTRKDEDHLQNHPSHATPLCLRAIWGFVYARSKFDRSFPITIQFTSHLHFILGIASSLFMRNMTRENLT